MKTLRIVLTGALIWLMTALPVSASQEAQLPQEELTSTENSGALTETVTWRFDGETLWLEGSGATPDYSYDSPNPWQEYADAIRYIVLGEGITHLGSYLFTELSHLERVTVPHSMSWIGQYAFAYCNALSEVIYPGNQEDWNRILIETENMALRLASGFPIHAEGSCGANITWVVEEDVLTIRGEGEMRFDTYFAPWREFGPIVRHARVEEGITSLGAQAFDAMSALTQVTLPSTLTGIGYGAFCYTNSLVRVDIPAAVTSLGYSCFYSSYALDTLVFCADAPEGLEECELAGQKITVYYPASASGWEEAIAGIEDADGTLCWVPYTDLEEAIRQQETVWAGGMHAGELYPVPDGMIWYDYRMPAFRVYPCEEAEGVYFLQDNSLWFLSFQSGIRTRELTIYDPVGFFESNNVFYWFTKGLVYAYDLVTRTERESFRLPGTVSATAFGVDGQGRFYTAVPSGSGSRLSLFAPDGTLLSSCESDNTVYSFDGFSGETGRFVMESFYSGEALGYNRGRAATVGEVKDGQIALVPVSNQYVWGVNRYELECLEFLSLNGYEDAESHQLGAQLFGDRWLVTLSIVLNRLQLINLAQAEVLWAAPALPDNGFYADTSSVGVRAAYLPQRESLLLYTDDSSLAEFTIEGGKKLALYQPAHPLFAIEKYGNTLILIEKEENAFYIELVDATLPEEASLEGPAQINVGETAALQIAGGFSLKPVCAWTSSDPQVASVSEDGTLVGWSAGTVEITANVYDGRILLQKTVSVSGQPNAPRLQTVSVANEMQTFNGSRNNYTVWSILVNSALYEQEDGTLTRVEEVSHINAVVAENWTTDGVRKSHVTLEHELMWYGGSFAGADAYYLVFGQPNGDESDETEVLRVVKYSREWERLGSYSLFGANTRFPFSAGSLRMAEADGKLYVYTCHEMYKSYDGLNHQANMTLVLDEEQMTLLDSVTNVMNIGCSYVSHSFNQFVRTDGTDVYRADHGDAYPRGISLTRCAVDGLVTDVDYIIPLTIPGEIGTNSTGVSLGGLEIGANRILLAGNSVAISDPESYSAYGPRNIFLASVRKDMKDSELIWSTEYDKSSTVWAYTPQLVRLNAYQFLLLWEENDSASGELCVRYVRLDESGRKIGDIERFDGRLSDCQPIFCADGLVRWYVTDTEMIFYALNPYAFEADPLPEPEYAVKVTDYTKGAAALSLDPEITFRGELTFTALCETACVVARKTADGYEELSCTTADGVPMFRVNVEADTELVVVLRGDTNLDGSVGTKDATFVRKIVAQVAGIENQLPDLALSKLAGDANADGSVGTKDATAIRKKVAGVAGFTLPWKEG